MNIMNNHMILLTSYAKINISLNILNKRKDNFHNLLTIMQKISLYDNLYIKINNEKKIKITSNNLKLPINNDNLVYKAALLFFDYTQIKNIGIDLHIEKRIPISAGLGGGSSNAAYTIIGLNKLFNDKLNNLELLNIAKKIGSDVPFFLNNNTALANSTGINLLELKNKIFYYIVICTPNKIISTKKIFQKFKFNFINKRSNYHEIIYAYKNNNYYKLLKNISNDLETTTTQYCYDIINIKKQFYKYKCDISLMTGSGPSVFALYKNYYSALKSYNYMKTIYKRTFLCYNKI